MEKSPEKTGRYAYLRRIFLFTFCGKENNFSEIVFFLKKLLIRNKDCE